MFHQGQLLVNRKNSKIGLRIESSKAPLQVQTVDFVDGRAIRSFVFEQAMVRKLHRDYVPLEDTRHSLENG